MDCTYSGIAYNQVIGEVARIKALFFYEIHLFGKAVFVDELLCDPPQCLPETLLQTSVLLLVEKLSGIKSQWTTSKFCYGIKPQAAMALS